jgi:hypothetical protein
MAEMKDSIVNFSGGCTDCGDRSAVLPIPLPGVDDDFDWKVRDYDSFRLFMMQELAYRFPERERWTPADMEAVIVELLAAALDRASHALDVVQAERYLETARRPQSVRRLLQLIGYDAVTRTDPIKLAALPPGDEQDTEAERLERYRRLTPAEQAKRLEQYWCLNPAEMEAAREEGPRVTGEVRRMVTLADHQSLLEEHPLVSRARARSVWSGAWNTILVSTLLSIPELIGEKNPLDAPLHTESSPADVPSEMDDEQWRAVETYHRVQNLGELPPVTEDLTARQILRVVIEQNRMLGTEVFLEQAKKAAVTFVLSVRARKGFFRSELKQALHQRFVADKGGFFEPGGLGFGEDLFASDIIEAAMEVEGVAIACLNQFKRVGAYPDRTAAGVIEIADDEFAMCANDSLTPEKGTYRIVVNAGELS